MKMNRRKALIGIGSLAVGSGAALGSGAFTSVEASRDVEVNVVGDNSAYLGIGTNGNYATDVSASGEAIDIGLGGDGSNGINDEAITDLGNVLTLTNNSEDTSINVGFDTSGSFSSGDSVDVVLSDATVTFTLSSTSNTGSNNTYKTLDSSTTSVSVSAKVDTTSDAGGTSPGETLDLRAE